MSLRSSLDMQMDVKDMSFFHDDSFESVIDKGKWMSFSKYAIQVSEFVVFLHVLRFNLNNFPNILHDLLTGIIGTLDSLMVSQIDIFLSFHYVFS